MEKMNYASPVVYQERLEGKVAIITGGASGIGESTVKLFHENGAKVVIADVQDSLGQDLAQKLGENVRYIHCDVRNEEEIRNLVDTTVAKLGKLDIMYNNAGIIDRVYGGIMDSTKSELDRLISVNIIGAFLGAKHAARVMIPQGKGCILFTLSACTEIGGLSTHSYAMTKHGILGLAKNLAAELGQYGIRVNSISPFGVATPLAHAGAGLLLRKIMRSPVAIGIAEKSVRAHGNLKGQILKPEGVAQAALYLASDDAKFVNGLNLVVDGGYSTVNPTMAQFVVRMLRMKSIVQGLGNLFIRAYQIGFHFKFIIILLVLMLSFTYPIFF